MAAPAISHLSYRSPADVQRFGSAHFYLIPGTPLTVSGDYLDTTTAVTVGGHSSTFTYDGFDLTVTPPANVKSGPLTVTNADGSGSYTDFVVPSHHGGWIQLPDQPTISAAAPAVGYRVTDSFTVTDQWDGTGSTVVNPDTSPEPFTLVDSIFTISGPVPRYSVETDTFLADPDLAMPHVLDDVPSGTVAVEFDAADPGTGRWPRTMNLTGSIDQTGSGFSSPTLVYKRLLPAEYTSAFHVALLVGGWIDPATANARATVASITAPTNSTVPVTVNPTDLDPGGYIALLACVSAWLNEEIGSNGDFEFTPFGPHVQFTGTYRPTRYRLWTVGVPPLRQYPRDDAVGGAPRQGQTNGSTSIQSSARQGWANTYR